MTSELQNLRYRREEVTADACVVTLEGGFAIIWAPGALHKAFTLLTDSEGGIIFDYGYSKYFMKSCSAFPRRKERKGGKAGAKLAVRHHSPQLQQGRMIKKM